MAEFQEMGVRQYDEGEKGRQASSAYVGGGENISIEASTTFTVMEAESLLRMFAGELGLGHNYVIYSRHFNPTVLNVSRLMAAMESTKAAYCTASGMSVMFQLLSSGDYVVAARTLYVGTHALLTHFLPQC